MNYYHTIKYLYPDIKDLEFALQDDGFGVYIRRWDYTGAPRPELAYLLEKEPEAMDAKAMNDMREKRVIILKESDWTQIADSPLANSKQIEWAVYRQALRDLPENFDLKNPAWPTQPAS